MADVSIHKVKQIDIGPVVSIGGGSYVLNIEITSDYFKNTAPRECISLFSKDKELLESIVIKSK